jgi:hypothetical protein
MSHNIKQIEKDMLTYLWFMSGHSLFCPVEVVSMQTVKQIVKYFMYIAVQKASDHHTVQTAAGLSFNVLLNTHNCVTSQTINMTFTVEI